MIKLVYGIVLFGLLIFIGGCGKKLETPGWEVNLNGAMLYSDMGIEDLIPDSILQVNANNSINLVYNSDFFNYGIDSVLAIPDSTMKDSFMSPLNSYANPGQVLFNSTDNNEINLNGPELVRLILQNGFCDYTVKSTVEDTVILTYSITSATQAGVPVSLVITVPPGSPTSPIVVNGSYDLINSDLDLTGYLHNTTNAYQTKMEVKIASGATGVSITAVQSKVSFTAKFRDLIPSYVKGYFGNYIESTNLETQNFDFIRSLNLTTLDLEQVSANLYINNGLGADARIRIDTFMAVNTSTSTSVLLNHPQIGQYININRATDMLYFAQPYSYNLAMNSSNSNIESFIESLPDQIKYKMLLELNPMGNISAHSDFLYANSRVNAGINIDIPLNLIASGLNLKDTLDFDLDSYDQNGKILRGKIKFNVCNGLPLSSLFNVKMLDENNMVIGYLINNMTIAGNTTSNSVSAGNNNYETLIAELNDDNIYQAYRCKKLVIEASFATSPSGSFAYIYSTQRFKTQVSLQVDYLTQE